MTAVEWLYDWMWTKDHHYFLESDLALAFSKAELMEKEQIIDAHFYGQCDETEGYPIEIAKQYYKETFKSE